VPHGTVQLTAVAHEGHGYCTEYLVERRDGAPLDRESLIAALDATGGDSILVVGDSDALHVHIHLDDPGPGLSAGVTFGELSDIKVDNMQLQHELWSASHRDAASRPAEVPAVGVVAAASGPGVARAFEALGAVPLVTDGKPTPAAFLDAARQAGTRRVFLLPNDVDAIMTAEQAASEAPDLIRVIPTRSIPAGIAATVACTPGEDDAGTEGAMCLAIEGVRCVEVTLAARQAHIGDVAAREGQPIALLDGRLVAAADTLEEALVQGLSAAVGPRSEVISVYLGRDAASVAADTLRDRLESAFPELAVEVVEGGQPYYPFVAGVE
jgi:dihydroxyacetone kinase-like predicted kinase